HHASAQAAPLFTWRGIVGDVRPPVSLGQRVIVVLRAPSVAQQVATHASSSRADERRWTAQAYSSQHRVFATLAEHGLGVRPEYSFTNVLNGFSASLDPRATALLDRDPRVHGIYPVRAAFPTSVPPGAAERPRDPRISLPGFD